MVKQNEGSGTHGPVAFLNQVFTKVNPKKFDKISNKETTTDPETAGNPSQDIEQLVSELLSKNPSMNSATFLNLLKSQGIKFTKEADSSTSNAMLVRGKESAISFRSVRFLEKDNGPSSTDVGLQKPKDKYLGFTKFRAVLLQEGLGNFGDAYFYSKAALDTAAPIFEGKKIYADHPSSLDEQIRPERSVRDVLGHFENVHVELMEDNRSQLVGDVVILPDESFKWARSLMAHAVEFHSKFPDKEFIGLSINASGDAEPVALSEYLKNDLPNSVKLKLNEAQEKGIETIRIVSVISDAVSCDLVTEAGAGGGVKNYLESRKEDKLMDKNEKENAEGGPGSGCHGDSCGRPPKGGQGKGEKKPAAKSSGKIDYLKHANDFEKTGAGRFTRAGKGGTDLHMHTNDWASARSFNDKVGGHGDIQPDAISGKIIVKVPNVYKQSENETENENLKQGDKMDPKEKEEKKEAIGQPASGDHADANQDVELIKSMLKKAFGGEEEPSEQECAIAKEAIEAYTEMGVESEQAKEKAMEFMKASKHMAAKQAKKEAEEKPAELKDEEKKEEAAEEKKEEGKEKKESAVNEEIIKLKGELAKYKEKDKKLAIQAHVEKVCKESKRSNAFTNDFKAIVKEAKSVEEVDKAWKLFEAGSKSVESAKYEGITFTTEKVATSSGIESTSISFDDCKVY